jgi:hypothetical protein
MTFFSPYLAQFGLPGMSGLLPNAIQPAGGIAAAPLTGAMSDGAMAPQFPNAGASPAARPAMPFSPMMAGPSMLQPNAPMSALAQMQQLQGNPLFAGLMKGMGQSPAQPNPAAGASPAGPNTLGNPEAVPADQPGPAAAQLPGFGPQQQGFFGQIWNLLPNASALAGLWGG